MNKLNRSKLNSIYEDFEKPDKDYQVANFRDYIKTDDFKTRVKRSQIQLKKKSLLDDKEINFLKQNETLVNLKQKSDEIDQVIHNKNDSNLSKIKSKLHLTRNPNIQNLLQDVRTKSSISKLQEDLKNEFDLFLNASFNQPKLSKKPGWNFLTLGEYNSEENESITKRSTEIKLKEVNINSQRNQVAIPASNTTKPIPVTNRISNKTPTKTAQSKIDSENAIKKTEIISNMQVALIENKTDGKNKPIIELNKMLESIKRIDLPKFQPELLQICQYGGDAQLFKFYPQVSHIYRN